MKKLELWRRRAPDQPVPKAPGAGDPTAPAFAAAPELTASREAVRRDDEEDTVPAAFYHQPD